MGFSGGGKRLMSFWLGNFLVGDVRRKEVSFVARSSVGASSRIVMYKGLIKRMRRRRLSCHLRITGLMAGRKGGGGGCVCVWVALWSSVSCVPSCQRRIPGIRLQSPTEGSRSFYGRTSSTGRSFCDKICIRTSSCPGCCPDR